MPALPSIKNFLSILNSDIARENRYLVSFMLPRGVPIMTQYINTKSNVGNIQQQDYTLNQAGAINLLCHTCSMPTRAISNQDIDIVGYSNSMPTAMNTDTLTLGFYSDDKLSSRKYFEAWMGAVINPVNNSLNFFNEYVSNITIKYLTRDNRTTYDVICYDCYPITLGSLDYAYANKDSVLNINVTLAYRLWKSNYDTSNMYL